MGLKEIVVGLRDRPLMFIRSADFNSVVSFIDGYNTACQHGALFGFCQWLALRAQFGANWHWTELVLHLACPDADRDGPLPTAVDKVALDRLFELLLEFEAERSKPDGLVNMLAAYARWRDEVVSKPFPL